MPFFIPPCPLPPSSGGDFWLLSSNAEPPQGKAQALGRSQAPAPCRDAPCSLAPRTCVCVHTSVRMRVLTGQDSQELSGGQ